MLSFSSVDVAEGVGGPQPRGAQAAGRAGDQAAEQGEARSRATIRPSVDGRVERDVVGAGAVDGALAEGPPTEPPGRGPAPPPAGDGRLRASAPSARRRAAPPIPISAPSTPPSAPCSSDSPVTWRTTLPLRPAERLQRAELADALGRPRRASAGRRSGRRPQRDDRQRGAELARQVLGVDERAADAVGEVGGGRHRRAGEASP